MLSSNVIKISHQFNNCAFHSFVPYIVSLISQTQRNSTEFQFNEITVNAQKRRQFQNSTGYWFFLEAFKEYYQLPDEANAQVHLQKLIDNHSHPLDLQVLFGPVLRETLKKVLLSSESAQKSIKESFLVLYDKCKEKNHEANSAAQKRDVNYVKTWLAQLNWGEDTEYDELFAPNIDVIATLLTKRKVWFSDYTNQIYQNYVEHVCSQQKGIYISQDLINQLCDSFNFKPLVNIEATPSVGNELAQIFFSNRTGDHWELKNKNNSKWNFTDHPELATFREYHEVTTALQSSGNNHEYIERIRRRFKEKIKNYLISDVPYNVDSFIQTDALFDQTPHDDMAMLHRYIRRPSRTKWPALHLAIYRGDNQEIKRLITQDVNWRQKVSWKVTNRRLSGSLKVFPDNVSALGLAASLNNRVAVNLLLQVANINTDADLIQEAYNLACSFGHSAALYSFLPLKLIKHRFQAVLNAIKYKDLYLVSSLVKLGAPIVTANVQDHQLFRFSLNVARDNADDVEFSIALHNLLFSLVHSQRLAITQNTDSFKINDDSLSVIVQAFDYSLPRWVENVFEYYQKMTKMHKVPKLEAVSNDNLIVLIEAVAKVACKAIDVNKAQRLRSCLIAQEGCFHFNGKFNPLHHALLHDRYDFAFNTYIDYILDTRSGAGELSQEQKEQTKGRLLTDFATFADRIFDEYDRSLTFRLQRVEYRKGLQREYQDADSLFKSVRTGASLVGNSLNEARIAVVDAHYKKTKHTAKLNDKTITKIGYPAMLAARSLSIIPNQGLIRFGLNLTWSFMPNVVKYPFVKTAQAVGRVAGPYVGTTAETAANYSGMLLDNVVSFALMPQFYVASTVLGNIVYYKFKDSGCDNLEAIAMLAADGAAFSLATGSESNYEIDEQYTYRLTKNLQPFAGEWATSTFLVPTISSIDGLVNKANYMVNYPIKALSPYLSASTLSKMSEAIGGPTFKIEDVSLPSMMQPIADLTMQGVDLFQSLHKFKRDKEEQLFHFLESSALDYMQDSASKSDRLHAIQVYKVSQINKNVEELKSSVEQLKLSSTIDQGALEAAQQSFTLQSNALAAAIELENTLFKQTEGYSYYETWQDKHLALKNAQVQKSTTQAQLAFLKADAQKAKEKSYFYNSESTNRASEAWALGVDELFAKHASNFPDWTKIAGFVQEIANSTFDYSSDRNEMAKFAADKIININYPFYPDMGNAQQIEAERQKYIEDISTYELKGYTSNPERAKNRLYHYVLAKVTNTEKQKHIHRFDKIFKPVINEILGNSIGWTPFKDFKGGKNANGSLGLQFNKQFGAPSRVDLTVAGTSVASLMTSSSKPKVKSTDLQNASLVPAQSQAIVSAKSANDAQISNCALDLHNPIMVDILANQLESMFGDVLKLKVPQVEVASKLQKRTQSALVQKEKSQRASVNKKVETISAISTSQAKQAQQQSWWRLAFRSARGEDSTEIRAWKRNNVKSAPKWLVELTRGVSSSAIPVTELPEIFGVAAKESLVELVEGAISLGEFAVNEIKHAAKGETLQTKKAISLLSVYIGEEAARVVLKEQTQTSKYAKELADSFDRMDKKDRVKAIAKIAISIAMPAVGAAKVAKLSKPMVQKVATATAPVASAARYTLRSAKVQQTMAQAVSGNILNQFQQHKLIKTKSFQEVMIRRSTPAEIHYGYGKLSKRQSDILTKLPRYRSEIVVRKSKLNVSDLAALTARTGDEFAMFTLGSQRMIIRGNNSSVYISELNIQKFQSEGWRWSAHTHPGTSDVSLQASGFPGDRHVLDKLGQERSLIVNSAGRRNVFDKTDNVLISLNASKKDMNPKRRKRM